MGTAGRRRSIENKPGKPHLTSGHLSNPCSNLQGGNGTFLPPSKNTEEAQYNMAFPVAAALIDGEVGPKQILPPRIHSSQILNLGDKLETEVSDDFEQMFPEKACAEVIIYTNDGRHFSSGRMEAQWEPPDTLPSDDELETKFQWLVEPVLGKEKTQQLVSMMWEFEKLEQVQDFIDSCVV